MPRKLTSATTLDNLKKEAKRWLKALRENDPEARERFQTAYPGAAGEPVLRDVQHALAREHGLENWNVLKLALPNAPAPEKRAARDYEQAAQDFVDGHKGDDAALQRLNRHYGRQFTTADLKAEIWRRVYSFRQRAFKGAETWVTVEEARVVVAQDAGFGSWEALMEAVATGAPPQGPPYAIHTKESRIGPSRQMSGADWDELIGAMKEHRISEFGSNGLVTDAVLKRIAELDHVTGLSLGGSRELSDDGLLYLARMPQLEKLELSEWPGGKITDRGLEVLRHLPNLRSFEMTWQSGVTDAGVANLRYCERLERVNLMGSPTGDGAIAALQGKPRLQHFSTGRLVTDAGLPLLHNFPMLKEWRSEEESGRLLIDGPFTNAGLAGLAGLAGVADVDLFWHVSGITTDAFAYLVELPNLMSLGCDGALADDTAMRHISALPRLRKLRAQEAVATEEGFVALGRSKTLQRFWGRVCPNFGSRGFVAFSKMPALEAFGIGCKNVDDAALATLPDFPALREITPIDFQDVGFRHVGRCRQLERLTCMYCRETGDAASAHIEGLGIKYYYAGLTQITDRSLEILGRMPSLEQVDFYECQHVTDAGLPFLAALPRLQEVHLDGLPRVTHAGTRVFPERVRVYYST